MLRYSDKHEKEVLKRIFKNVNFEKLKYEGSQKLGDLAVLLRGSDKRVSLQPTGKVCEIRGPLQRDVDAIHHAVADDLYVFNKRRESFRTSSPSDCSISSDQSNLEEHFPRRKSGM